VNLGDDEIRRVLGWANGCDGESFIRAEDWPLIEKLAAAVGDDPAEVAPQCVLWELKEESP
jgi:hypothetical protein